jgi:hypothetical protein
MRKIYKIKKESKKELTNNNTHKIKIKQNLRKNEIKRKYTYI